MTKIVLDAGHYYHTVGKRTPKGANGVTREWTLNNNVCKYITEDLKSYNVEVTRVDDVKGLIPITLKTRVSKINKSNPKLVVSIHHNALNGKFGSHTGTEVYMHTLGTSKDKQFANIIAPKLAKETGLVNRGVKKKALAILACKASIPAVLCEGGFMDSKKDYPIITSEQGQRAYAKAVTDSIIEFLGLKLVNKPSKSTTKYKKGTYKTLYTMKVRTGAGINFSIKTKKELTADGKKNANVWGHYKKGTLFTALEIIEKGNEVWARGHSGYVCIKDTITTYCEKVK